MAADSLAARRRRAVAERSATFVAVAGLPVRDPAPGGEEPAGRADLVVLLPSADAATVLLLCAEAAELSG